MGLCAPAVVAAHAALEGGAADDRLIVIPGQFIEMAGVFQLMRRIGSAEKVMPSPAKPMPIFNPLPVTAARYTSVRLPHSCG
mgnify:CR=1 FL=1